MIWGFSHCASSVRKLRVAVRAAGSKKQSGLRLLWLDFKVFQLQFAL
ncbi:hypothetical protein CTATCC11996_16734 [Comamonas testosteroni ATCC 11996]|nr:hypothetical protein CTATCC11996_16734 [Comamonas testosteroni ATCC 11996]